MSAVPHTHAETPDPLIDEIRRIREELSQRLGSDPVKLAAYLRQFEGKTGGPIVREPGLDEHTRAV